MLEEIIQRAWPEWRVEEKIGKGGFGTVFKVDKVGGISMPSAIKVISVPGDESEIDSLEAEGYSEEQSNVYFREYLNGLEKEIEMMAKLKSSNNIVKIEDYKIVEKEEGFGWFVLVRMELLTPLTAIIKQRTLQEEEIIKLGMDICSALELCEKEGIIHRDIKPANIFVDQNGNYKLGDFGIARELGSRSVKTVAGTEQYIAPEVMVGKYDCRADIYSLGLVLYSLLNNNNLPFLSNVTKVNPGKRAEAIKRRLEGNESFPTPMNASEEMADLLMWACLYDKVGKWKSEEKDVSYTEKRIENASRLKKELSDVLSGSYVLRGDRTVKISRPQEPKPEPTKKNKKMKILIGLLVLIFLVGGGIAFGAVFMNREDKEAGSNAGNKEIENSITAVPSETEEPTPTSTPEPEEHKHVYAEETVRKATCGQEGEVKFFCQECGDTYTDVLPVMGEHSYESDTDETCDVCGAVRKVGHDFKSEITKEATCGEAGEKVYTCSECGESYTEKLYATGKHSYKNACDESCDVCGKTRKVSHTYVSKVTKKATCGEEGKKVYTCSVCGDSYTESISATGKHSYKDACDESCNVCGKIRKVSHTYESEITKEATCGEDGRKTYTCSVCGDSYTEKISATGKHSYYNECDDSCDVCGAVRQASHSYTSKITKQATCGEEGQRKYTCSVCGDSFTEKISATGNHSYKNACDGSCDVCGATRQVSHSYVSEITKQATCSEEGKKTYTCSVCGDAYTEKISATGKHSYTNACDDSCNVCGKTRTVEHTWKSATCTTARTCTVCGKTEGSANGHKFSSSTDITCDVCNTVCGYLEKGEWSEWQDTKRNPDETLEEDTPRQEVVGYNTKIMYKYSRYYGYYKEGGYYLGLDYKSGICTTYEETIWLDEPLPWNKEWSNAQNRYNEGYGYGYTADGKTGGKKIFWYNQVSEPFDDLNSPKYKTQYRYREVYAVYY